MSVADVPLGPIAPRCATHPEELASGTCTRCGGFFCAACRQPLLDKAYCAGCAQRPDINYLEVFRLKLWGKRDASAWTMVSWGGVLAVIAVTMGVQRQYAATLVLGACAGLCVAFFLRAAWSRVALILAPVVLGVLSVPLNAIPAVMPLVLTVIFALFAYANTRSQLFFQLQVPVAQLQKLWHLRENNPIARNALSFAAGALIIPLFAPVAIVLGVIGLQRVNPRATPPVGRRADAIGAIVLGVLVIAGWTHALWPLISSLWQHAPR
jgi:cytochrome c oxidase subunit IV